MMEDCAVAAGVRLRWIMGCMVLAMFMMNSASLQGAAQGAGPGIPLALVKDFVKNYLTAIEIEQYKPISAEPTRLEEDKKEDEDDRKLFDASKVAPDYTLIYNYEGYQKPGMRPDDIEGAVLTNTPSHAVAPAIQHDPIGYAIYLPKNGDVKGVVVNVYGGTNNPEGNAGKLMNAPHGFNSINKLLLEKGFAVVHVSLVDLRDLKVKQGSMPKELYDRIHESIHEFHQALRNPTSLHPDLKGLEGKPLFLLGHSFGGSMAISHAQRYPGSFNGYISFSGSHSVVYGEGTRWLDAYRAPEEIVKLQDPLLLINNFDDNRVRLSDPLDFYKKVKDAKKDHLVRFWVNREGGSQKFEDMIFKGHYLPNDPATFGRMASMLLQFLEQPRGGRISSLHDWRALKHGALYQHRRDEGAPGSHQSPLDEKEASSLPIKDLVLAKAFAAYKNLDAGLQKAFKEELLKAPGDLWHTNIDPLIPDIAFQGIFGDTPYQAFLLKQVMDTLFTPDVINNQMKNTLNAFLPGFVPYIQETYPIRKGSAWVIPWVNALARDKDAQAFVLKQLTGLVRIPKTLLKSYIRGNPDVVAAIINSSVIDETLETLQHPWNKATAPRYLTQAMSAALRTRLSKEPDLARFINYATEKDPAAKAQFTNELQHALLTMIEQESNLMKKTMKTVATGVRAATRLKTRGKSATASAVPPSIREYGRQRE